LVVMVPDGPIKVAFPGGPGIVVLVALIVVEEPGIEVVVLPATLKLSPSLHGPSPIVFQV